MASFAVLKSKLSLHKDVEYTDKMQQNFRQENNKGLTVHYVLEWSALFLFLITTLTGDVVAGMK